MTVNDPKRTVDNLKSHKYYWSIPEIMDTSEKGDNAPGGVSCHNDDVKPNNSKKKPSGWLARKGRVSSRSSRI